MIKGKNFSANNLGQRKKSDFYETPYSLTEHILEEENICGSILEPACGNGAITKVLDRFNLAYICYDRETDFLKETKKFDNIITNPPFSLAYEFIQKAKEISNKKIILLLPLSYLHGKQRLDNIWKDRDFPFKCIYVFCRYPMLGEKLREDGKYNTGMMVYAWYVWDKNYIGEPVVRWIDNNDDIIRKEDAKIN